MDVFLALNINRIEKSNKKKNTEKCCFSHFSYQCEKKNILQNNRVSHIFWLVVSKGSMHCSVEAFLETNRFTSCQRRNNEGRYKDCYFLAVLFCF